MEGYGEEFNDIQDIMAWIRLEKNFEIFYRKVKMPSIQVSTHSQRCLFGNEFSFLRWERCLLISASIYDWHISFFYQ